MTVSEQKASILKRLEQTTNEELLQKVEALLTIYDETIAGYAPDGKPYTYSMLKSDIAKSDEEFDAGGGVSIDELRQKVKSWGKPSK